MEIPISCLKTSILCAMLAISSVAFHAQTTPDPQLHTQPAPESQNDVASDSTSFTQKNVVHVAGLEETKANMTGNLTLSPAALTFSNKDISTSIPRERIVNVFIGDQQTEPWGTTGKIARKVIPYGGGEVLAFATNKKVDLLTVEYLDIHDAYHGVVFVLPVQKAAAARDQILAKLAPPVAVAASSCAEPLPNTVMVEPIKVDGVELPAEYRILVYEQMIKELKLKQPEERFFRVGDRSAGPGCAATGLDITVTNFKKGNRSARAATGPLGLFIGTTSLTFDVNIKDVNDKTVFDAQMKKSDRTDSDSLGLADTIAKNVAKSFSKATQSSPVQVASAR
jgi:hypothetical protein